MATFAEYSNRYDRVRSQLGSITNQTTLIANEVSRGAVLGSPDFVGSRLDALDNQIDANIDALNALSEEIASSDLTASQQESLQRVIDQTGNGYLDQQQRIFGIRRQAQENERARKRLEETQPKNSAGDIVSNEQDANTESADVQSPQQEDLVLNDQGRVVTAPENENTGSNALQTETLVDAEDVNTAVVGSETPVIPNEQTQIPNTQAATTNDDDATDSQQIDNNDSSTGVDGRPSVAKEFLQPIVAKPNLLSGLSSITYSLSWYLMNDDEYEQFVQAEQKILPTQQLLVQSAGANKSERNEWFNVDFYIEDFKLESIVGTQGVGSPHNAITLEFDVVEPNGITLLNRLNNAVISHLGEDATTMNAMSQTYLMVIRFYGYDASGNPVTAADLGLPATTDSDSVIEKFIPFTITNFSYKIASKLTQYSIKAACVGTNVAFSTQRGAVPFNIQLTASTVDQLFNGNAVLQNSQAEEEGQTNQSGNTQTIVSGLVQALNNHQQRLAGKSYNIPDEYEIIFQDADIKNAKLLKPGNANKGTASNQTSQQAAQKYLSSKLNYDKESRSWSVPAGMQITQLLDLVLRTSSYITSQQNIFIDEKTGKIQQQSSKVPTVQWYRIKSKTKPIGYDTKRKTMAYRITYIINKYQINTPRSPHFPPAEYRGVHKLYNYWYTGLNTELLDFEIDVNNNYFVVIGNDGLTDETPNGSIPVQQAYSSAPGQSLQGGEKGSTFPAANLSDRLYSIGDVASSSIEIVGDPDWIQQNELVYTSTAGLGPYLPDGGINYDSQEVLFEIRFNPAQDYNLETGLTDVYENNRTIEINGQVSETNVAQESLVFNAISVTSTFSDGKFTQRITGNYRDFAGSKNAPPEKQVQPSQTTEQKLADTGEGREGTSAAKTPGINQGTPRSGVTTNKESPGIVVEIVPNDQFPDDDAGFRIDSRGNRVNFNIDR